MKATSIIEAANMGLDVNKRKYNKSEKKEMENVLRRKEEF